MELCSRRLFAGSRLIISKLRCGSVLATSSFGYSTEGSSGQNGSDTDCYDVVISGGGMVGSAMAAALGKTGMLVYG